MNQLRSVHRVNGPFTVTDVGTEAVSRQMKFLPIGGNDVTEDDESGDVDHLENVTSRQAVLATTSAIFKEWRRRQRPIALTSRKTEAIFLNLSRKMKSLRSWEKLFQSSQ